MSDLTDRFDHHPPSHESIAAQHGGVRSDLLTIASFWEETIPPCREVSLALTKLEEAMFWANAAIARHQVEVLALHQEALGRG